MGIENAEKSSRKLWKAVSSFIMNDGLASQSYMTLYQTTENAIINKGEIKSKEKFEKRELSTEPKFVQRERLKYYPIMNWKYAHFCKIKQKYCDCLLWQKCLTDKFFPCRLLHAGTILCLL